MHHLHSETRSIDFFLVSNETGQMKDDVKSKLLYVHILSMLSSNSSYQCYSNDDHPIQVFPVTHQSYRIHTHSERKKEKEYFSFVVCKNQKKKN